MIGYNHSHIYAFHTKYTHHNVMWADVWILQRYIFVISVLCILCVFVFYSSCSKARSSNILHSGQDNGTIAEWCVIYCHIHFIPMYCFKSKCIHKAVTEPST